MSDANNEERRVGRDEMNLCEFPITLLADCVPQGLKTLTFEGQHGKLTVSGSDAYGLPTAPDTDVIVGLIQLTKRRNDFTNPTVEFSRCELLKLLSWPDQTHFYRRLSESLHRWVGVMLRYDGCWWDNKVKCRVDASFHILDRVVIYDQEVRHKLRARRQTLPLSSFTWGKDFFDSCQADNLKRLDLDTYFVLKSAVSKQLYRFLDKRFYLRGEWAFDLQELAFGHVGLSRNYAPRKIKEKIQPALEELEEIGFLEPMSPADRYSKAGRGRWSIRVVRKLPPPTKPEPTGLERELISRGVTRGVAAELVREFPEERIRAKIDQTDWLRERRPKKVKDLGAYLAEAIRKDFAAPAGFKNEAERAEAEATARARREQQEQARGAKARERDRERAARASWEGLTADERKRIEAEALAHADPAAREEYEAEPVPVLRRMRLTAIRNAYLGSLLQGSKIVR